MIYYFLASPTPTQWEKRSCILFHLIMLGMPIWLALANTMLPDASRSWKLTPVIGVVLFSLCGCHRKKSFPSLGGCYPFRLNPRMSHMEETWDYVPLSSSTTITTTTIYHLFISLLELELRSKQADTGYALTDLSELRQDSWQKAGLI